MQAIFNEEEQLLEVPEDAHSKSTAFTLSNFTPKGKSKVSSSSMNSSSAANKKRQGKSDTIDLITALNLNKEVDLHKLTYKDMVTTSCLFHFSLVIASVLNRLLFYSCGPKLVNISDKL